MLKEIPKAKLKKLHKEENSRWFRDDYFDLFLWEDDTGWITGFQLCYDIYHDHRTINWKEGAGLSHYAVDDGENRPGKPKATPVLLPAGHFDVTDVAEKFRRSGEKIDSKIFDFVYNKILEYGNWQATLTLKLHGIHNFKKTLLFSRVKTLSEIVGVLCYRTWSDIHACS